MLKCWSFRAEERPTFKYCLQVLENLKQSCADSPLPGDGTYKTYYFLLHSLLIEFCFIFSESSIRFMFNSLLESNPIVVALPFFSIELHQ